MVRLVVSLRADGSFPGGLIHAAVGRSGGCGATPFEALRVAGKCCVQCGGALFLNLARTTEMDRLGRHEADAAAAVFGVVPGKCGLRELLRDAES